VTFVCLWVNLAEINMRRFLLPILFVVVFAACKSSTSLEPNSPATIPPNGTSYTYKVVTADGTTFQEIATISSANDTFNVSRLSDTVNHFQTSGEEQYRVDPNGDLLPYILACDYAPLPVATHRTYTPPPIYVPTKLNGYVDDSSYVKEETYYEKMEDVTTIAGTFQSVVIKRIITIRGSDGKSDGGHKIVSVTHRYWYAPTIHFFVKDQTIGDTLVSKDLIRTLVSYTLGK
jgi:hypothetical protein